MLVCLKSVSRFKPAGLLTSSHRRFGDRADWAAISPVLIARVPVFRIGTFIVEVKCVTIVGVIIAIGICGPTATVDTYTVTPRANKTAIVGAIALAGGGEEQIRSSDIHDESIVRIIPIGGIKISNIDLKIAIQVACGHAEACGTWVIDGLHRSLREIGLLQLRLRCVPQIVVPFDAGIIMLSGS